MTDETRSPQAACTFFHGSNYNCPPNLSIIFKIFMITQSLAMIFIETPTEYQVAKGPDSHPVSNT